MKGTTGAGFADWLSKEYSLGRISRREFIGKMGTLGMTAVAASSMAGQLAMAAAPKKGGRFRVGVKHGSTTDSLDPAKNIGTHVTLDFAWRGYLVETDADGFAVPRLAESWEASSDAKTWVFRIRKGVEFHNGKTVTPRDVINSLNHHRGEGSESSFRPQMESVEDIAEDGDNVVIRLSSGNADLPYLLSDFHVSIHPATEGGIDWESGVSTGGYQFVSNDPGVRSELKRHPNFWKSDRAHFDEVEILALIDATARMSALVAGRVDAIDTVDLKTLPLLKRNKNLSIIETNGGQHFTFPMRTDTAPFDNNDVRLALKYAVDREELVSKILGGHGTVANDQPISSANIYFDPGLEARVYDPDKAKYHLKKAGLTELSVSLHVADAAFAGATDAAVLYSEHANKAGITITPEREPNDGYWSNIWMKKPWSGAYWGGQPTADLQFTQAFSAGAPWNDAYWEHDRFNELLVSARSELDQPKRRAMYSEMQRIVRDEGGVVIPMFANNVYAVSDRIGYGKLEPRWALDTQRASERWWFK